MKIISYIGTAILSIIFANQSYASYKYQSSCQVKDGYMQVHLETNEIGIDIYGDVNIKTYDRYNNTTRTSTVFLNTNASPYSLKTIVYEDVPSYVHRCEANFSEASVTPENSLPERRTHIIVHERPQPDRIIIHERSQPDRIIIHEQRPSPRVSVDLHIPVGDLLFPSVRIHDAPRVRIKERHHNKRKVRKHHHHRTRVREKHKLVIL